MQRVILRRYLSSSSSSLSANDKIILDRLRAGTLSSQHLERELKDTSEAVRIRRLFVHEISKSDFKYLPRTGPDFDTDSFYKAVNGANAESVIGYIPLPVGVVGPLKVDGVNYMVPLATTEGALIASTNRGARAIALGGGADTAILRDGMTRSPLVALPTAVAAADFAKWIEAPERFQELSDLFSSTTRFGKFSSVKATVAGRNVFLRIRCTTGDAMGMNMVGKGVNKIIEHLTTIIPGLELIALSGNTCTDKKPSAVNWIDGRGKSVVAEAFIPASVVRDILKTNVNDICRVALKKNLIGSSLAGSIGGNNAHAANVVTGIYLATGQDPAQNVVSSNTMTLFESLENGEVLHASVTMPSLEVGTIGGGTVLPAQGACLDMLGVRGSSQDDPGANAKKLASIIAASVLAGELSLNAALASNHLISAHMDLNRKKSEVGVSMVGTGSHEKRTKSATQLATGSSSLGHTMQVRPQTSSKRDKEREYEIGTPRLTVP